MRTASHLRFSERCANRPLSQIGFIAAGASWQDMKWRNSAMTRNFKNGLLVAAVLATASPLLLTSVAFAKDPPTKEERAAAREKAKAARTGAQQTREEAQQARVQAQQARAPARDAHQDAAQARER